MIHDKDDGRFGGWYTAWLVESAFDWLKRLAL